MGLKIYLAAPYSHDDTSVREERVRQTSAIAAKLMMAGYVVFSPITHGHGIADYLDPSVAHDHEFWMEQSLPLLESCNWLVVLPLDGWEESKGIGRELRYARKHSIPAFIWATASSGREGFCDFFDYVPGEFNT